MLNRREISVALAAGLAAGAMLTGSGSAHAAASLSCESRYDGVAVPGQHVHAHLRCGGVLPVGCLGLPL
jgi:hypothetical protein